MTPAITVIFGGPGCGKTARLLRETQRLMDSGISPKAIAYVAFTVAAATEAATRAAKQYQINDLPYWRTIHSLAFRATGLSRDEVMQAKDFKEFSAWSGEPLTHDRWADGALAERTPGDRYLTIHQYARTTGTALRDAWDSLNLEVDFWSADRFSRAYTEWKAAHGKVDFTDMLTGAVDTAAPITTVQAVIVDEAQDLTAIQWQLLWHLFPSATEWYIAGDDDQAIYRWAGADVAQFLGLRGRDNAVVEELPVSHRLSIAGHAFASRLASRIVERQEKHFQPSPTAVPGSVRTYTTWETVPIQAIGGSWLVLARHWYQIPHLVRWLEELGMPHSIRDHNTVPADHATSIMAWQSLRKGEAVSGKAIRVLAKVLDKPLPNGVVPTGTYTREHMPGWPLHLGWQNAFMAWSVRQKIYYRALQRSGYTLTDTPRVRVDTIHGVKGMEADHVLVCTDLSSRTLALMQRDADPEHRVFYVAITRSRNSIHIVMPQSPRGYRFPQTGDLA